MLLNLTGIVVRLRHLPLDGPWHEPWLQQDRIDVGQEFIWEAHELRRVVWRYCVSYTLMQEPHKSKNKNSFSSSSAVIDHADVKLHTDGKGWKNTEIIISNEILKGHSWENHFQTHNAMSSPTVRAGAFPRSTSLCETTTSSPTATSLCTVTKTTLRLRAKSVASVKPLTLGRMRERDGRGPRRGRGGYGRTRDTMKYFCIGFIFLKSFRVYSFQWIIQLQSRWIC